MFKNISWKNFGIASIVLVLLILIGLRNFKKYDEPAGSFQIIDEVGNEIDYKDLYLSDGRVDSPREGIFAKLDQAINLIQERGLDFNEGNVIYYANGEKTGAIAIFQFSKDRKIKLTKYLESSLFFLPITSAKLVDLNGDGLEDIFFLTHSGNYLNIERPWLFIYKDGDYSLVTPLTPTGIDPRKALSGEIPAGNAMEIRMPAGAKAVWLRDLDGDGISEVITLDQGYYPDPGEVITELTKRIYKLQGDVFAVQSEIHISRDSEEYRELKSWETIQENQPIPHP